jgi:hypothetical protein
VGLAHANRATMSGLVCRAQDVYEHDLATQIAGQLSAGSGGAIAATRVIDSTDNAIAHGALLYG